MNCLYFCKKKPPTYGEKQSKSMSYEEVKKLNNRQVILLDSRYDITITDIPPIKQITYSSDNISLPSTCDIFP